MLKIITLRKIVLVFLIAILGAGFVIYRRITAKSAPAYTTSEVRKGTLIVSISGGGNVVAKNMAEINPDISGEVTEVFVIEGDEVKKGQILLKIKNDNLEASRAQAYTAYLQAKEAVEKAKLDGFSVQADLDNLKQKDTDDPESVTDLQIQIAEQKIRSADLSIQSAENKAWSAGLDYQEAKDKASQREVKAPIAGTITSLNVEVGDELEGKTASNAASGGSLLTIVDLGNLAAKVDINEIDALNIKKDQKATLTFDVFSEEKKFTGKVEKIDTLGTTTQGVTTYQAEIILDSVESSIKPGMSVSADIITQSKENVLLVPNSAIKTSGGQNYIQVLLEDKVPQNVTVEVGLSSSQQTEIVSGVNEGDQVITTTGSSQNQPASFGSQGLRGIIPGGGFGGGEVRIMR